MQKIRTFLFEEPTTRLQKIVIVVIYIFAFILFAHRLYTYSMKFMFPDELMHISYIAYLEDTDAVIPKFENMYSLDLPNFQIPHKDSAPFSDTTVNYLCHPPLYYNIMKAFNFVKVENGIVSYDFYGLRHVARIIMYLALLLAFYIGLTRIKKVFTHFVYAFTLISFPLFYIGGIVCNDELSFLAINIFLFGIIRFFENRRNYLTYFLIAIGISMCLLNKVTASVIIIFASIIIIIYTRIKEKNWKFLFCKQFLVTLPLYLIPFIYYIIIILNYGTVQPTLRTITSSNYFKTTTFYVREQSRPKYDFFRYFKYFWEKFLSYWGGFTLNRNNPYRKFNEVIPSMFLLVFPVISLFFNIKNKAVCKKKEFLLYATYIGLIIAVIIQFCKAFYEFKYVTGYLGCYRSRYYVCMAVPLTMLFCNMLDKMYFYINKMKDKNFIHFIFSILVIAYVIDIYMVNLI